MTAPVHNAKTAHVGCACEACQRGRVLDLAYRPGGALEQINLDLDPACAECWLDREITFAADCERNGFATHPYLEAGISLLTAHVPDGVPDEVVRLDCGHPDSPARQAAYADAAEFAACYCRTATDAPRRGRVQLLLVLMGQLVLKEAF